MKQLINLLFLCLIFFSCSEDNERESETAEFLGEWKLTEVLIDPGDGSGTFQSVVGNSTLEFLTHGKIRSNYSLCPMYEGTATQFITPYLAADNKIIPKNCFLEGYDIVYELQDENLILSYPCYEGCLYKFVRTE
jgi:hypothetical protein